MIGLIFLLASGPKACAFSEIRPPNLSLDAKTKAFCLDVTAPNAADNIVLSWSTSPDSVVSFDLQPIGCDRWYRLGTWSSDAAFRTSTNGQKDEFGFVDTDTLKMKQSCSDFKLRVSGHGRVLRLFASWVDSQAPRPSRPPRKAAWGKTLDVEKLNQGDYPDGDKLCSPTSLCMLLRYWSKIIHRPDLNLDVPAVAAGVNDPGWPGTGNWPFNAAYAASFGLTAYVTRLNNIPELEAWIDEGIPIACSVSRGILRGAPARLPNDGHIVVLIGFEKNGDVILNEPGRRDPVHAVIPRMVFDHAWSVSGRTVYCVYPQNRRAPRLNGGPWLR